MSDPHELQDILASIQEDIDKTIALINRAVSGGSRELLDVAHQLKQARIPIVGAQFLINVAPGGNSPPELTQIQRVRPGPLEQVEPRKNTDSPDSKRITCPLCSAFLQRSDLPEHMVTAHPQSMQPEARRIGEVQSKSAKQKSIASSRPVALPVSAAAPKRPMTTCPVCSVTVREDRLDRHLKKTHPQTLRPQAAAPRGSTPMQYTTAGSSTKPKARRGTSVSTRSQTYLSDFERDRETSLEALDQSYRDRRDGGKELSQSRRDHGQYGSLPVYDDYGEDSFS